VKIEKQILPFGVNNDNPQMDRILLSIDREKLSKVSVKTDTLILEGNDGHGAGIKVFVKIDAEVPAADYPKGTYVQTGDYISIPAVNFAAVSNVADGSEWKSLPEYGREWGAVKAFPVINSYNKGKGAPAVEYHFVPKQSGVNCFDFYLNPSNPAYKDNKLQFIAEINGEKLLCNAVDPDAFAVGDHQEPWGTDVTNNIRISSVYADCKEGVNVLKVYPVTPNIVLEKIVISDVNTVIPESYMGAPETFRVK